MEEGSTNQALQSQSQWQPRMHDQWASDFLRATSGWWEHLRGRSVTVPYSGHCSGTEAGFHAAKTLALAMKHELDCTVELPIQYASEHPGKEGEPPVRFLRANCPAERMYRCVHKHVAGGPQGGPVDWCSPHLTRSMDVESGATFVPPPTPGSGGLHVSGYMCNSNSTMNRHKKTTVPGTPRLPGGPDPYGLSRTTYLSVKASIIQDRPKRWIIENVGTAPVHETVEDLRGTVALGDYAIQGFRTNALDFGSRTRRNRAFIVGCSVDIIRVPPDQWLSILTLMCRDPSNTPPASAFMFPDDHPTVKGICGVAGAVQPETKREVWRQEHEAVRAALADPPPPATQADLDAWAVHGVTTQREVELLGLLWKACLERVGDPQVLDLNWDLSAEASHRWFLDPQTSGHRELLHLLHFPPETDFSQNSDAELRRLAGLGISLPQIGASSGL